MYVVESVVPAILGFEDFANLEDTMLNANGLVGGVGWYLCTYRLAVWCENANICEGTGTISALSTLQQKALFRET